LALLFAQILFNRRTHRRIHRRTLHHIHPRSLLLELYPTLPSRRLSQAHPRLLHSGHHLLVVRYLASRHLLVFRHLAGRLLDFGRHIIDHYF